ncbi:hypothetical protein [Flavobacterium ardleyense]|uniref:hypothetical protein n=1 Tax=Flavobacterium ardleyense TaxID=2038737 RepID=UPI00298D09B7|nr:hypothetical protein [Flavobacterium ardleyense]
MNEQIVTVISSISRWNEVKKDKEKVFSLWQQCSSFKVILPPFSNCKDNFHIYFGVQENKQTMSDTIVMHIISDYNDNPELIKNFENAEDYIFSIVLDNKIGSEPAEIDEAEARRRIIAWQNPEILKEYLEKNEAYDVFSIGKDDFLLENGYLAYFGMKFNKNQITTYSPDLIIQNNSPEHSATYYDLARICPPYGTESLFGLQDLSS